MVLRVALDRIEALPDFAAFASWLRSPGPWLAAFDFPFGLPRELVLDLGWPQQWPALIRHYAALPRDQVRATFAAYCAARPAGGKFAHRACDRPAGSSPSMKWVNPPVAIMLHAGAPLLLAAGVHLPGLHEGDRERVALEGYPGLLAREMIGARSYKSDQKSQQTDGTPGRTQRPGARARGRQHPIGLEPGAHAARSATSLIADASGDRLDAVLCLMQAAWASLQPGYGLAATRSTHSKAGSSARRPRERSARQSPAARIYGAAPRAHRSMNSRCSSVSGECGAMAAFVHHLPLGANQCECLVGREALFDQQAAHHRAGAADAGAAVQVDVRSLRERGVDRLQRAAHAAH